MKWFYGSDKFVWAEFMVWCRMWTVFGNTICFLTDGIWMRFEWWKDQGWWLTWSAKKRLGERFGWEFPSFEIRFKRWRIAIFFLDQPGWSLDKEV